MNKIQIIAKVAEKLNEADRNSGLINFMDDELDWNAIAKIAVDTVLEEIDALQSTAES